MMRTSAGSAFPNQKRSTTSTSYPRSSSLGIKAEPTYPAPPATRIRISLLKVLLDSLLGYFIRNDGRKLACGSAPLALSRRQPKWAGDYGNFSWSDAAIKEQRRHSRRGQSI